MGRIIYQNEALGLNRLGLRFKKPSEAMQLSYVNKTERNGFFVESTLRRKQAPTVTLNQSDPALWHIV